MSRSEVQRKSWRDPAIRRRRIQGLRRLWKTEGHRERVREGVRRWASSAEGQEHLSECGRKTILLGRRGNPSRPERIMAALLRRRGIPFEMHVRFGRWIADFVVGNVILEVDSERFHAQPRVRARDARKDAELRKLGYTVRRISAEKLMRLVSHRGPQKAEDVE